ncbi:MAG: glyoxalase [Lachnospiraceae bacterium]|nr:glyoxalase [Lachnospiraceae bacterium]
MYMYDDKTVRVFLERQLELYPETVAETADEVRDFLEDTFAAVAKDRSEVMEYLEEVGVDTEGLSEEEIFDMPEIMEIGDGRYLILEV